MVVVSIVKFNYPTSGLNQKVRELYEVETTGYREPASPKAAPYSPTLKLFYARAYTQGTKKPLKRGCVRSIINGVSIPVLVFC